MVPSFGVWIVAPVHRILKFGDEDVKVPILLVSGVKFLNTSQCLATELKSFPVECSVSIWLLSQPQLQRQLNPI